MAGGRSWAPRLQGEGCQARKARSSSERGQVRTYRQRSLLGISSALAPQALSLGTCSIPGESLLAP